MYFVILSSGQINKSTASAMAVAAAIGFKNVYYKNSE
jgi:hypothetical protein